MEAYVCVKNFGKIETARVNISNFTIFVGNNNSGKTQLMELIYAIVKQLSALTPNLEIPRIDGIDAFRIGEKEIQDLNGWANSYLCSNINKIIEQTFNASIPIEEVSLEWGKADWQYDIYFLTDRTVEYLLGKGLLTPEALTELLLDKGHYGVMVVKKQAGKAQEQEMGSRFSKGIPIEVAKNIEIGRVLGKILGGKSPGSSNVLFLPASRMGLMQLYKHYFGNPEQGKSAAVQDQKLKGITKPVEDFLYFLLKYSYTERMAKNHRELLEFIFNHLIDGTIREKGDATVYTPREQQKEIPIFVASSMVNEVVPMTKALTDADEIDFIFYDEVETSMHPLKQVEMVKLLNRLNNNGIKLLVSTHSDTMATKINNLLLLSRGGIELEAAKSLLGKNGIAVEKEDFLISEDIHVYQFLNEDRGKSIVKELEFQKTPCIGYDFRLFNDSTMHLFEEAKVAMGIQDEA